jgi:hypothetical protein
MGVLADLVFGRSGRGKPHIQAPPRGVKLKAVRPRRDEAVQAELARESGELHTGDGALRYAAGEHYLVRYENGDRAAVLKAIFERTYQRRSDGRYEKRPDLVLHYFTLPHDVVVDTLEGPHEAEAGDWIMQGVIGELYPVAREVAREKYAPS